MTRRHTIVHSSGVGGCPVCDLEPQCFAKIEDRTRIPSAPLSLLPDNFRECIRCGQISLLFGQDGAALTQPRPVFDEGPLEMGAARAFYRHGGRLTDAASWQAWLSSYAEGGVAAAPPVQIFQIVEREGIPLWQKTHPGEPEESEAREIEVPAAIYPEGTHLIIILPEAKP
jgi:hypothetical protein